MLVPSLKLTKIRPESRRTRQKHVQRPRLDLSRYRSCAGREEATRLTEQHNEALRATNYTERIQGLRKHFERLSGTQGKGRPLWELVEPSAKADRRVHLLQSEIVQWIRIGRIIFEVDPTKASLKVLPKPVFAPTDHGLRRLKEVLHFLHSAPMVHSLKNPPVVVFKENNTLGEVLTHFDEFSCRHAVVRYRSSYRLLTQRTIRAWMASNPGAIHQSPHAVFLKRVMHCQTVLDGYAYLPQDATLEEARATLLKHAKVPEEFVILVTATGNARRKPKFLITFDDLFPQGVPKMASKGKSKRKSDSLTQAFIREFNAFEQWIKDVTGVDSAENLFDAVEKADPQSNIGRKRWQIHNWRQRRNMVFHDEGIFSEAAMVRITRYGLERFRELVESVKSPAKLMPKYEIDRVRFFYDHEPLDHAVSFLHRTGRSYFLVDKEGHEYVVLSWDDIFRWYEGNSAMGGNHLEVPSITELIPASLEDERLSDVAEVKFLGPKDREDVALRTLNGLAKACADGNRMAPVIIVTEDGTPGGKRLTYLTEEDRYRLEHIWA